MKKLTFKHYIIIIFPLTLIGSCGSFFSQYVMGLKPCSLCIYQRLGVMATAFLALLCLPFSLRSVWGKLLSSLLLLVPIISGLAVSIHHLYILYYPNAVANCGPGFNLTLRKMELNGTPMVDILGKVLKNHARCDEIANLFGLPLPVWSAGLFSFLLLLLLLAWVKGR
ncbi:MAG: disulfide bond formation protein B [Neisseriaceae bacterium]|nr:disulfide bond formation protein B [Neisseriaceae bacterium]